MSELPPLLPPPPTPFLSLEVRRRSWDPASSPAGPGSASTLAPPRLLLLWPRREGLPRETAEASGPGLLRSEGSGSPAGRRSHSHSIEQQRQRQGSLRPLPPIIRPAASSPRRARPWPSPTPPGGSWRRWTRWPGAATQGEERARRSRKLLLRAGAPRQRRGKLNNRGAPLFRLRLRRLRARRWGPSLRRSRRRPLLLSSSSSSSSCGQRCLRGST